MTRDWKMSGCAATSKNCVFNPTLDEEVSLQESSQSKDCHLALVFEIESHCVAEAGLEFTR